MASSVCVVDILADDGPVGGVEGVFAQDAVSVLEAVEDEAVGDAVAVVVGGVDLGRVVAGVEADEDGVARAQQVGKLGKEGRGVAAGKVACDVISINWISQTRRCNTNARAEREDALRAGGIGAVADPGEAVVVGAEQAVEDDVGEGRDGG